MAWPVGGTDGWETIGTDITTSPVSEPLPEPRVGTYYDPSPLGGVGILPDQVVIEFGDHEAVVRRQSSTVEAMLTQGGVYGFSLVDQFVVPEILDPCSVVLEVYDDDRATVKWRVGTSPSETWPYLLQPDRYAEQEIDPATGGASLSTVTVQVIDPATTAGDQDSGWLTERLQDTGLADIAGRRCILKRFISDLLGFQILADGPAGSVRLDSSYSSFVWEIRDTRETERKVRIFDGGGGIEGATSEDSFNPTGAKTLLPDGVYGGYGFDAESSTYLIDPATPLLGRWKIGQAGYPYENTGQVNLQSTPGNAEALRAMSYAAADAMRGSVEILETEVLSSTTEYKYRVTFQDLLVLWREAGSSDPWVEIGATNLIHDAKAIDDGFTAAYFHDYLCFLSPHPGGTPTGKIATSLMFGDQRGTLGGFLPTPNQDIEFYVVYRGPPSKELPVYIEGLTAGQFAANVYAGVYSPRDANGDIKASGILYDEAGVLTMTDPVRMRLVEVIEDARAWLEKYIYGPVGFAPALDILAQISPVSQVAPTAFDALLALTDDNTQAAPDWSSGERIINVLQMVYPRDYIPNNPEDSDTGDGLAEREVVIEFEDPVSVTRHGRQVLTLQGDAFRAIGDENGDALEAGFQAEWSYLMGVQRQTHVQNRYALGAQTMSLAVKRTAFPLLRCGDWVLLNLSWLPDYATGKRGLIGLAQVVAVGDLDCAWRQVLLEQVVALIEPGS